MVEKTNYELKNQKKIKSIINSIYLKLKFW